MKDSPKVLDAAQLHLLSLIVMEYVHPATGTPDSVEISYKFSRLLRGMLNAPDIPEERKDIQSGGHDGGFIPRIAHEMLFWKGSIAMSVRILRRRRLLATWRGHWTTLSATCAPSSGINWASAWANTFANPVFRRRRRCSFPRTRMYPRSPRNRASSLYSHFPEPSRKRTEWLRRRIARRFADHRLAAQAAVSVTFPASTGAAALRLPFSKYSSISSSVRPLVSGRKKAAVMKYTTVQPAQKRNIAE